MCFLFVPPQLLYCQLILCKLISSRFLIPHHGEAPHVCDHLTRRSEYHACVLFWTNHLGGRHCWPLWADENARYADHRSQKYIFLKVYVYNFEIQLYSSNLAPVPPRLFSNVMTLHWHNVNVNKISTLLKLCPTNADDIVLTLSLGNRCMYPNISLDKTVFTHIAAVWSVSGFGQHWFR